MLDPTKQTNRLRCRWLLFDGASPSREEHERGVFQDISPQLAMAFAMRPQAIVTMTQRFNFDRRKRHCNVAFTAQSISRPPLSLGIGSGVSYLSKFRILRRPRLILLGIASGLFEAAVKDKVSSGSSFLALFWHGLRPLLSLCSVCHWLAAHHADGYVSAVVCSGGLV